MTPTSDITTSIPRITINGLRSYYTSGSVIDHTNRTVSATIMEMEESKPLTDLLRSLRAGDVVNLKFMSVIPQYTKNVVTFDSDPLKGTVEYEGKATPIMIRVRPNRHEVFSVKFRFRLLE